MQDKKQMYKFLLMMDQGMLRMAKLKTQIMCYGSSSATLNVWCPNFMMSSLITTAGMSEVRYVMNWPM